MGRRCAVAMAGDLNLGLRLVDQLAQEGTLPNYPLLEATRDDLLRRRGDLDAASVAYRAALAATRSEPERRFLERRLTEVAGA